MFLEVGDQRSGQLYRVGVNGYVANIVPFRMKNISKITMNRSRKLPVNMWSLPTKSHTLRMSVFVVLTVLCKNL